MKTDTVTTRRRGRGRKPRMHQVAVGLSDDVLILVERQADIHRQDRSQVLRDLVVQALEARGKLKPAEARI